MSTIDETSGSSSEMVGYLNGRWMLNDKMSLSVNDGGFRQGVTVVERLRTYNGKLFATDAHLQRWEHSASELQLDGLPSVADIQSLLNELLDRNSTIIEAHQDVGITIFATPGVAGESTIGLHLNPLNHLQNAVRQQSGQPLVMTDVQQPAFESWPRSIKVRCRIHYYRADLIARRHAEAAVGVLLDRDGSVTETSIANLAIVLNDEVVSPEPSQILGGVTQAEIERLADRAGLRWEKRRIMPQELVDSTEILLMGTDCGLWFANEVWFDSANAVGQAKQAGPVYSRLRSMFDDLVGHSR